MLKVIGQITSAAIAINLATISPVSGQDSEHVPLAVDHAKYVDNLMRGEARRLGVRYVEEILSRTRFEVDDKNPFPFVLVARTDQRGQEIVVSARFVLLLYYFADIAAVNRDGAWANCSWEYTNYVRRTYTRLAMERSHGQNANPIMPPEAYATSIGGTCRGLEKYIPISEHLRPARNHDVTNGLAFMYLHELGHLYHKHRVITLPSGTPSSEEDFAIGLGQLCRSREQELEADEFAAAASVDLGGNLASLQTSLWAFLMATQDFDPALEQLTTHPSPVRRWAQAADNVRYHMEARGLHLNEDILDLIEDTIAFYKRIERELPAPDVPGFSPTDCS